MISGEGQLPLKTQEGMQRDSLEHSVDLRRADIDPQLFAAALAVQHVCRLIAHGGSRFGRAGDEDALHPDDLEVFLTRAVEMAHNTRHLEWEWRELHQMVPRIKIAWEQGQVLFQETLTHAMSDEEQLGYLSEIDFAVDCFAYVSAHSTYPQNRALQAWLINGYMLAWRQHFLNDQKEDLREGGL
jgi:hypothetical protein